MCINERKSLREPASACLTRCEPEPNLWWPQNESVPDSIESGRSFEQPFPRSLLTTSLRSDPHWGNGSYVPLAALVSYGCNPRQLHFVSAWRRLELIVVLMKWKRTRLDSHLLPRWAGVQTRTDLWQAGLLRKILPQPPHLCCCAILFSVRTGLWLRTTEGTGSALSWHLLI